MDQNEQNPIINASVLPDGQEAGAAFTPAENPEIIPQEAAAETEDMPVSYFDGGLLQLIGWVILGVIVTVCTLGICFPWAYCMIYRWQAKHTVVDGRRLVFDGTAFQLFGNWIKWLVLTFVTLGIYGLWVGIKLMKWKAKHTHFAD